MSQPVPESVRAAEEAVQDLVLACRKGGPLHKQNAPAAALMSRSAKWLLHAIARFRNPSPPRARSRSRHS